ncbi:hypothetical protein T484DRAFT_1791952, partial [Baffinella frigidus]
MTSRGAGAMLESVVVRLNVGGAEVHTSLTTLLEGARQGGTLFQRLCGQVLGPGWSSVAESGVPPDTFVGGEESAEHFVDVSPALFSLVLDYLRDGELPRMEVNVMENVRLFARRQKMEQLEELAGSEQLRLSPIKVMEFLNGQRNLSAMDLREINLANFDLRGATFYGCRLDGANLTGARFDENNCLERASLTSTVLVKANLSRVQASAADFGGAFLSNATLAGTCLQDAKFVAADLRNADLSGAQAGGADFTRANLSKAVLQKAFLAKT